jgi:hypothetical protein
MAFEDTGTDGANVASDNCSPARHHTGRAPGSDQPRREHGPAWPPDALTRLLMEDGVTEDALDALFSTVVAIRRSD